MSVSDSSRCRTGYNSEAFTPEEVSKGLHLKLVSTLLEISDEQEDSHYDIHITSDGYCTIVEWCQVHEDFGGKFAFVDEDQVVMTEFRFPDGHYEMFESDDEIDESLAAWLKENPGWVKNSYGIWVNEEENERAKKALGIE